MMQTAVARCVEIGSWAGVGLILSLSFASAAADQEAGQPPAACKAAVSSDFLESCEYFDSAARRSDDHAIGLALAGGGTRASQFSIGVLKGLADAEVLPHLTHLSTVSGGGYAGYWYVSQTMNGASPVELFRDCVPARYAETARALRAGRELPRCSVAYAQRRTACLCLTNLPGVQEDGKEVTNYTNVLPGHPQEGFIDPFRYQNNLRGHTDLFAPRFSYASTRSDERLLPEIALPIAAQLATSLTVDLLGDVLFDWNVNFSASKKLYRNGISRIYGQPPIDCGFFLNEADRQCQQPPRGECLINRPLADEDKSGCQKDSESKRTISFADLKRGAEDKRIPYWIINATTPVLNCPKSGKSDDPLCSLREVFSDGSYPPHKASFEFTGDYWGSGEFGYWPVSGEYRPFGNQLDEISEAVAASAAFFDPRQRSFMLGGLINGLLQITGFRWGYYVKNPHVDDSERRIHRALPLIYLFHRWVENRDAVDIHLIDGGQSDNLGAYALIRRRIPNIIISDHAGESDPGNMEDICRLRRNLTLQEFANVNDGYVWHVQFDDLEDLEAVCNIKVSPSELHPTAPQVEQSYRYNLHAWHLPVVRGCAVEVLAGRKIDPGLSCEALRRLVAQSLVSSRGRNYLNLFLIKPALDLRKFSGDAGAAGGELADAELESEIELRGFLKVNSSVTSKDILLFPNHTTVNLTADSSPWLYGAYRELAAQSARTLRWTNGELVVFRTSAEASLKPELSYLVDREARKLTKALNNRPRAD